MRHTKRGKVIRRTKSVYCIAYVFIFCFRYELWRETRLHICIENLAIRIVHWFLNRFYLSLSYSNLWGSFAFKHHFSSVILADDYCAKRILFSIISRDRFSSVHFSLSMVHAIVGRTLNEVWKMQTKLYGIGMAIMMIIENQDLCVWTNAWSRKHWSSFVATLMFNGK